MVAGPHVCGVAYLLPDERDDAHPFFPISSTEP
jgi:hypothetical protein